MLGWQFQLDLTTVQSVQIGFLGIAVALLGRNTALGVFLASLLFGALLTGTSTRNLDPTIFKPELASSLTEIIQGLVVLFVGADLLIIYLWQARRKLPFVPKKRAERPVEA
jgi:simple sugar transport system permease protein